MEHILIIGGGGTGGALAHDLTLRGFKVTLVEQGSLMSGTSGRHHGLLHSGARYALHDIETGRQASKHFCKSRQIPAAHPCAGATWPAAVSVLPRSFRRGISPIFSGLWETVRQGRIPIRRL